MQLLDLEPGTGDELSELVGVEPPVHAVGRTPAAGGVGEDPGCLLRMAGQGPGEDRRRPVGDQQAEPPAGTQDAGDRREGLDRVVHHLEDAVAQDHVDALPPHQIGEIGEVTLLTHDAVVEPALGDAALQSSQGVGARVDDSDPVTTQGERDGETARASPGVEDVEAGSGRVGLGQDGRQHLPDDGCPHRARRPGDPSRPR